MPDARCPVAAPMCQPLDRLTPTSDAANSPQRQLSARFLSLVVRFIGAVLLLAAGLKAHALLTEPSAGQQWLEVALVEVESICGLALLLNVYPRIVRWAALALLGVLFLGATYYIATGARSCACFGKVQLTPLIPLLFDACALVVLWRWTPSGQPSQYLPRLICLAPLLLLMAIPVAGSTARFPQVILHSATLNVGEVIQASTVEIPLKTMNPHDKAVTIERMESTCPCLVPSGLPWVISPRTGAMHKAVLALNEEPMFSGRLIIELKGRTTGGELAFSGQLRMNVVPPGSKHQ